MRIATTLLRWLPPLLWLAAGASARAELSSLNGRLESRVEYDDNYRLEPAPGLGVKSLVLAGGLEAARRTDVTTTRLSVDLSARATSPALPSERSGAALDLSHTAKTALDEWNVGASYQRSTTYAQRDSAAEVALPPGRRTRQGVAFGWSHAWRERFTTRLGADVGWTDFAESSTSVDYRNAVLTSSASYLWSELDTLGAQLNVSMYRADAGGNASDSTSGSLSWRRSWNESSALSLSAGAFHTRSDTTRPAVVCPLPVSFCQAGLVNYIVVLAAGSSASSGGQFSAAFSQRLSEREGLSIALSRQLAPSGLGAVGRDDAASLMLDQAWSDTLSTMAALSYLRSNFSSEGSASSSPRLLSASLGLSKTLSRDLALTAGWRFARSDGVASRAAASSHRLSLGLTLQWPKAEFVH